MHIVTDRIHKDEPCWGLWEGRKGGRWIQRVFIVRGDAVAKFETDYGPISKWPDAVEIIYPSFGENSVGQLQELAERDRHSDKWAKRGRERLAGSTLIADILRQEEILIDVKARVYAAEEGGPFQAPAYMLGPVMTKTLEDGRFMFVSRAEDAPEYKLGTVKCFLNPDSPMREIVEAVGLGAIKCLKVTLRSEHSKRMHGQHRHKQEWAAVQEYLEDRKEEKREARQDEQLEATLSIARGGQTAVAVPKGECDVCGKTGFKNVGAHKRGAHKEV